MIQDDLSMALDPALAMEALGHSPDPWQEEFLRSTAARSILLCSRQAGKSTTTSVLALHTATYTPNALVLLLSPSLRQSNEIFRKVKEVLSAINSTPIKRESALRLELENGSRIISLPGKEETVRGFSGVTLLIVDEASRVSDELYFSIRPMLAVSGGRLVLLSTPFAKRGFFHDEWTNGGPDWERIRITAYDCPRISKTFLEEEKRSLGQRWFNQEYCCEFLDSEDNLFEYDTVMNAFVDDVPPLLER